MSTHSTATDGMSSRVEYANPPIVEALCQFDFIEPISWSPITPGMFYERIRAEYPLEPEVQQQLQANVSFPGDAGAAQFTMGQGEQRLIYRDETESRLIVLTPHSLSANSLAPYEGWPNLSRRFSRALNKAQEVLKPPMVGAVLVRYINRIVAPVHEQNDVGQIFNIPFRVPSGRIVGVSSLFQRVQATLDVDEMQSTLTFSSVDPQDGDPPGQAFLLDLELRQPVPHGCTFDEALAIAGRLKAVENEEFEGCITDEARRLFQ